MLYGPAKVCFQGQLEHSRSTSGRCVSEPATAKAQHSTLTADVWPHDHKRHEQNAVSGLRLIRLALATGQKIYRRTLLHASQSKSFYPSPLSLRENVGAFFILGFQKIFDVCRLQGEATGYLASRVEEGGGNGRGG